MGDNQSITLSLPRKLLKQAKRVAADRETSVSALMTEALARLADEDRRYASAFSRRNRVKEVTWPGSSLE